jgi:hypothetical protein
MQKYTQEELMAKNIKALETNNYTIEEIISDVDFWFSDLVIPVTDSSRGWKIACKKLADKVRNLQNELKECRN